MSGIATLEGSGTQRVLMLHGWALDSAVWLTARSLTDLSRFTYAFFDFPGYGTQRSVAPAEGIDGMARAALAAADALGWDRFAVVGHSMGGGTAMRLASLAPERVTQVVALTPISAAGTPLPAEVYEQYRSLWPNTGQALHGLGPHLTERQLQNIVSRCGQVLDRKVWETYLANWSRANFLDQLGKGRAPTTIVYGASDPLVNADYLASTVAALKSGRLERLEGAGHYPMLEQPEECVRLWEEALMAGSARA